MADIEVPLLSVGNWGGICSTCVAMLKVILMLAPNSSKCQLL